MLLLAAATANLPNLNQELYLHQLYVDENNIAMEELPPGTRLVEGKFEVLEEFVELDSQVAGDRRTAGLVMELANGICPYLQMEADFPSNHTSGWMPILNLAVKVAEDKSISFK